MPTAVISDIHGNAEALKRVLADIDARGIKRTICLGDIVGYGPEPLECVDLVRARCEWSLMGNHDFGVLYEPTSFNASAETAAYWTRERFDKEPDAALRASRYEFLGKLRVRVVETPPGLSFPVIAVHGSPRRPINEYIFAEDTMREPDKLKSIFDRVERACIVGHTHVPGVFTDEPDFYPPAELGEGKYAFTPDERVIINVGSVGQPRDLDPRASYAILYGAGEGRPPSSGAKEGYVEFVRLEYDIEATAKKIKAVPELSDWLAERLFEGR